MVVGGSNGVFQRRLELTREQEKGRCELHRVASFRRSDHQKATLSNGGGNVVSVEPRLKVCRGTHLNSPTFIWCLWSPLMSVRVTVAIGEFSMSRHTKLWCTIVRPSDNGKGLTSVVLLFEIMKPSVC
ncbi:hypothetical protein V6N13_062064 [Hibiscus sabdariffa]